MLFRSAKTPSPPSVPDYINELFKDGIGVVIDLIPAENSIKREKYIPKDLDEEVAFISNSTSITKKDEITDFICSGAEFKRKDFLLKDKDEERMVSEVRFKDWPSDSAITCEHLIALGGMVLDINVPTRVQCEPGSRTADVITCFFAARKKVAVAITASNGKICTKEFIANTLADVIAAGRESRGMDFIKNDIEFTAVLMALQHCNAPLLAENLRSSANSAAATPDANGNEIGRASCRERVSLVV